MYNYCTIIGKYNAMYNCGDMGGRCDGPKTKPYGCFFLILSKAARNITFLVAKNLTNNLRPNSNFIGQKIVTFPPIGFYRQCYNLSKTLEIRPLAHLKCAYEINQIIFLIR